MFPLESLTITEWRASGKELTRLLTYFPKLSHLAVSHCEKITGLGVTGLQAKTPGPSYSASKVDIGAKEDIVALKEKQLLLLPSQLQKLRIGYCEDLSLCSNLHDDINENAGGLLGLSSLRQLKIWNCPKLLLAYSSSSFPFPFPFPNSLEDLRICRPERSTYRTYRNYIEVLVPLSNLTSLTCLNIRNYGNSRGDGLLSLLRGHLTKLSVKGTLNFFVDSETSQVHGQDLRTRSSKLQDLEIDDVAGFSFTAFRHSLHFSLLTTLKFECDYKVERFTEEQEALLFINSLEKINFVSCRRLKSLPARLRGLPNLKRPQIYECDSIPMLPEDALPSSLQELEINCCKEIQSLPKDCLPSSLQKLVITNCRAIRSLPMVDDLPSLLQELDVRFSRSEELRRQCHKLIGIIPIVHA